MSIKPLVEPKSRFCKKSYWILNAARDTASELLLLFDEPNGQPRGPGVPSNADQDLLRSMLIFAGAGLDASIKQLIKETFPIIVEKDDTAQSKVIEHFSKLVGRAETASSKDLVRWLFQDKPRNAMIDDLIQELTSNSLQSKQQVEKVVEYMKLDRRNVLTVGDQELKAAFDVRNLIIHELDVDFSRPAMAGKRTRTQRRRDEMVKHTNAVIAIASGFLSEVDKKLS
jgi:hypothetical protein